MSLQKEDGASSSIESGLQQNENYMLGHVSGGAQENRRLDKQHDAIRHGIMSGRLVHESIPITSLRGPIADVCCGTGVWLKDLAEELAVTPGWTEQESSLPTFVGFDLTASAFREDLAPNMQLVRHDCCQPYGSEYVGKFDLVNMRGLAYAIPEAVFGKLFSNACSLLKPGGYIQWLETESQLWTSKPESKDFAKALDLIMKERSEQHLVRYMPDFMIQQYLSLSPLTINQSSKPSDGASLSLINFSLNPGGASRMEAIHDTDLNNHLSKIILETMKLLLEGSLLKEKQVTNGADIAHGHRDVPAITRSVQNVNDALSTGTPIVSGHFPLLIARKVGNVTTTED